MKKRVYDNENLEKLLNRYIKEQKYGGFKPLLNEIFLRRAYEFRFDERHMKKEIKNFVRRTERIAFGKNIPRVKKNTDAIYRANLKKGSIYFNCESKTFQETDIDWLDMYEGLTHEVYHTISHHISRRNKWIGLFNASKDTGHALNEIVNETAANRTTYPRNDCDEERYRAETRGYGDTTFIANLLATSFGIEERELLRGGIQNREEFQKACKKYITDEDYQNDVLFHFDRLEANLDFLYNALYDEEKNKMDSYVIVSSLKEIFCQVYEIASVCVSKSSRETSQEYAEELAYAFSKIRVIMANGLTRFVKQGNITIETSEKILGEAFHSSLGFLNKVSDILVLTNQKSHIADEAMWQEMEQLAKEGELIENAEKFGIEVEEDFVNRYKIIKDYKQTNKEFENPIRVG